MTKDIDQILAKNISTLRRQKGWTQEMLAIFAGLSEGAIRKIEVCERWPSPPTIARIAKAFGVQPQQLFADFEEKPISGPSDSDVVNFLLERMGYKPVHLKRAGKWPKKNFTE